MKITRFEDIEAWQVSRRLSHLVFETTGRAGFRKQSELRSQLRRAATSATQDTRSTDDEEFATLYGKAEEVKRLIGGFVRYLSSTAESGPRPRTED